MRRLVLFALAVIVGCSVGDPDSDQPLFIVAALSPTGGTFTATHRNAFGAGGGSSQTYSGTGSFQEVLRSAAGGIIDTSLQEIRGIYTGDSLIIGFGTRLVDGGPGADVGALSGSLQNAEGRHLQTLSCRVRYGASDASGSAYRVTFRMTADLGRVCRTP